MAHFRVIRCKTRLPEQTFRTSVDFPGDISKVFHTDEVFRVVCSKCGLIDKATTRGKAEEIGNKHFRLGHK